METLISEIREVKAMLQRALAEPPPKAWYTPAEFARRAGRSVITVQWWCRGGRINAKKAPSGRGAHEAWLIAHSELERYLSAPNGQKLLPRQRKGGGHDKASA